MLACGARFCNACASPLEAEAPTADTTLRSSRTSQSEQLDPEDVRAILSGYLRPRP